MKNNKLQASIVLRNSKIKCMLIALYLFFASLPLLAQTMPIASFTGDTIRCRGQVATFVNTSQNATSVEWSVTGGDHAKYVFEGGVNVYFYNTTMYQLTLIATNNAGVDTIIKNIYIYDPFTVNISGGINGYSCQLGTGLGLTANTNQPNSTYTYNWNNGDDEQTMQTHIGHTLVGYNYSVVVTDEHGCVASATAGPFFGTSPVNGLHIEGIYIGWEAINSSYRVCENEPLNFTFITQPASLMASVSSQYNGIIISGSSRYKEFVFTPYSNGCAGASTTLHVEVVPELSMTANNQTVATTACVGDTVFLSASTEWVTTVSNHTWHVGNNTFYTPYNDLTYDYIPDSVGIVNAYVGYNSSITGCESDEVIINIFPSPQVELSAPNSIYPSDPQLCMSISPTSANYHYYWEGVGTDPNNNNSSICINSSALTPYIGTVLAYKVHVVDINNNCETVINKNVSVSFPMGTTIVTDNETVIYPIGNSNSFMLNLPNLTQNANIQVYDLLGRIYYKKTLLPVHNQQIDLSNLSTNMYIVEIIQENKRWVQKISIF